MSEFLAPRSLTSTIELPPLVTEISRCPERGGSQWSAQVNPFTVIDLVALVAAVDGSIEMIAANAPAAQNARHAADPEEPAHPVRGPHRGTPFTVSLSLTTWLTI